MSIGRDINSMKQNRWDPSSLLCLRNTLLGVSRWVPQTLSSNYLGELKAEQSSGKILDVVGDIWEHLGSSCDASGWNLWEASVGGIWGGIWEASGRHLEAGRHLGSGKHLGSITSS